MAKHKKIPKHGRSQSSIEKDMGLRSSAADVPLGNTDPTVVQGVMLGGMPNRSRMARGGIRTYRGKYN